MSTDSSFGRGCIFHWGVFSVPAFDSPASALTRKIQNGSEWYLKRLLDSEFPAKSGNGGYKTSGWKETKEFHQKLPSGSTYWDFAKYFASDKKVVAANMKKWIQTAKTFGATYAILTAKHHDGYCLWPSKAAEHKSDYDWIAEFRGACEEEKIKFGIYYSWYEFQQPATKEFFAKVVCPQIIELFQYKPEHWWFDGDWICKSKSAQSIIANICEMIHRVTPSALINDRLADLTLKSDPFTLSKHANYRVYADRSFQPESKDKQVPWQHINTIGLSWGYNCMQKAEHYKTGKQLLDIAVQVKERKDDFLINLAPDRNGALDEREVAAIEEMSKLEHTKSD